jgi:hypothetical protein
MMGGMAVVFDYSWARPDPQELLRNGCTGVMRYAATGPNNAGKVLSIPERNRLWAAGLPIGLVWEQDAGRPKGGYGAGVVDAAAANAFADRLDWPADVPIGYAVDYDPRQGLPTIADYFRGLLSVPGRPVGSYGSWDVMELTAGLEHAGRRVVCHWQCAGWSGPAVVEPLVRLDNGERRRRSVHACMVQDLEATRLAGTDVNHVFGPVEFLYHPEIARPAGGPNQWEALMGKALNGDAAGLEGLWTVQLAFGQWVRTKIVSPGQHRLLAAAGELEQGAPGPHGYGDPVAPVVLDAELAQELKDLQVGSGQNGALGLAAQVIGQIKAELAADEDVDAQAVADRIIPKLQAAVDAAVDAQLDAAGHALAD